MHPLHFRRIVTETLVAMGPPYDSPSAVELLMVTAAQESQLGEYLWQHRHGQPRGPAIGPYQFEPATHHDLWMSYIGSDMDRRFAVLHAAGMDVMSYPPPASRLATNLAYATAICRLNYWRKPGALPAADDIEGLAAYWHRWHCAGCKGQPADAIRNYRRYVLRQKDES